MKKLLLGLGAFLIIAFGGYRFAEYKIMGGDPYYIQITTDGEKQIDKADNGQEIINYRYDLPGYDEKGNEKQIDFNGFQDRPMRKNAYLKVIWNKNKGVTSYEEVKEKEIPQPAQKKLSKGTINHG